MKLILTLLLAFTCASVVANDDYLDSMELDTISIEGDYQQPRMSAADKLKKLRKKLEQKNEEMVQKKIATMRLRNELELTKQMQDLFNKQMKALESLDN